MLTIYQKIKFRKVCRTFVTYLEAVEVPRSENCYRLLTICEEIKFRKLGKKDTLDIPYQAVEISERTARTRPRCRPLSGGSRTGVARTRVEKSDIVATYLQDAYVEKKYK